MKILFTGGGTAGHVFPIIAIVREIKRTHPKENFQFFYLGPKDKFTTSLLSQEGIIIKTILAGKVRRYFSFKNIVDILFKLPIGIFQAFYYIFVISPDLVFSKGGYGSIPAAITGWMLLTPIFLHESDVSPGLANKIISKLALEIFTAFPLEKTEYFPAKKMISVGNPIRTSLLRKENLDSLMNKTHNLKLRKEILEGDKKEAKKIFRLAKGKPVILILGGSQGAQRINDKILLVLSELLENFEVIHQTGEGNFEEVKAESEVVITKSSKKYYHVFSFLNEKELSCALQVADLIISRAGAGSIFEIAAVGKPSILVPLPGAAQNHQTKNAYAFAENGASLVMEEVNFTPHFLLERLKNLFQNPKKLREMAKGAKEFSKPDAARIIAGYIVAYLTQ